MKISVVVVAYNEEDNMHDILDSLVAQDYPNEDYEVIVVDGSSADRTPQITQEYCDQHPNFRLVDNPRRFIASSRNVGIRSASHPFIAFTDADCVAPSDWLSNFCKHYQDLSQQHPNIAGLGAGNVPPPDTRPFVKAIALAGTTFAGSLGSIQNAVPEQAVTVRSISTCNALYKKEALEKINGFNEAMTNKGEDFFLNWSLRQQDYVLLSIPGNIVLHKNEPDLGKFWRNMYGYGKDRAFITYATGEWLNIYLLPLLFMAGMVASLLLGLVFPLAGLLWPAYFLTILLLSVWVGLRNQAISFIPMVCFVFFCLHFGYGLGQFLGMFTQWRHTKLATGGVS